MRPDIGPGGIFPDYALPDHTGTVRSLAFVSFFMGDPSGYVQRAQRPGAGDVIAHFASGESILRYEPAPPMAGTTGDIEALSMWAGQSVALARQPQPAADIVAELTSRL